MSIPSHTPLPISPIFYLLITSLINHQKTTCKTQMGKTNMDGGSTSFEKKYRVFEKKIQSLIKDTEPLEKRYRAL